MEHYFQNKVEVIGFASPRNGKDLNSSDTSCPRNFKTLPILGLAKPITEKNAKKRKIEMHINFFNLIEKNAQNQKISMN